MATSSDYDEYMIAADLTLYSNPLNAALLDSATKQAKTTSTMPSSSSAQSKSKESSSSDAEEDLDKMIASDMTKYDSPLSELDIAALKKDTKHNHTTGLGRSKSVSNSDRKTDVEKPSK